MDIFEEKGRKKNERDKNKQKTAKRIRAKGCRLRDTFTDLNHAKALALTQNHAVADFVTVNPQKRYGKASVLFENQFIYT